MKICMVDLAQSNNLVGSTLGRLVGMKIRELCNAPAVALSFERASMVDATFMREAVVRTVMVFSPGTAVVVTGLERFDISVGRVPNAATLKESILAHHTSAEDAGRIAQAAGVKTLVLSHLVPADDPALTEQMWLDAARVHFRGTVIVGKDLLEI